MKIKSIITILLISIGQSLLAYPITPRPLRKLIIESENIVYANVLKIESNESEDSLNEAKAILVIKEKLQGEIKKDTIEVYFSPTMICPSPAHYEKGAMVLAFLDKKKKGYTTHALSYGSKTMNESTYTIYKKRIIEMQSLLQLKEGKEKSSKTLDWLISCTINPETREEGTYESSPESNFMSYYDKDKETFTTKHLLNKNQISVLRKAFFNIKELNYTEIALIDLIAKKEDKEVLDFLTDKLKEVKIERLWYKSFLFERIAKISNREDLQQIVDKIRDIDVMDEKSQRKENKLAKQFIDKL